jgi:hypothetical protein
MERLDQANACPELLERSGFERDWKEDQTMKKLSMLVVPVLVTFSPLFMALSVPAQRTPEGTALHLVNIAAALGLALGLALLYRLVAKLQEELENLREVEGR